MLGKTDKLQLVKIQPTPDSVEPKRVCNIICVNRLKKRVENTQEKNPKKGVYYGSKISCKKRTKDKTPS